RQIYFQKKILDCQYQLEEFKKQAPISIDIQELDNIIYNFIQRDQYLLRIEFERQRQMLKMDAQDHEFVNAFYELNPRQTEKLPTVENVLEAIENRQQNMIECIRYHTEQTIKIIFPE
ncbi:unnamed protein product, partial [Rotaria socialis]